MPRRSGNGILLVSKRKWISYAQLAAVPAAAVVVPAPDSAASSAACSTAFDAS